ncbi:hypothetical protein CP977_00895 [Streptomyces cinereoruber]|uniref:DUF3375 domain-containing protein n=1 Tax=Streptomyces cinereoruber TaxID=67260 RepID=A0ABX6B6K3_9ACTN|nr:hypothetical protein [Streptomyces cinereoruber]QEV30928.1 hypothetical protein CP977_00895 [Streptomyces cinereoruber]
MRDQPDLFSVQQEDSADGLQHISPFIAPVAATAGAVTNDPVALRIAEAIRDVFGDSGSENGLSRAEIAQACVSVASVEEFDARFHVFTKLQLLEPLRQKAHDQRYVFNPTSGAALLVYERLGEAGGVHEITMLLDRTREGILNGSLTEADLAAKIAKVRRSLANYTNHLLRLVRTRPIEELFGQRHHHAHAASIQEAKHVVRAIAERYPALRPADTRLIQEALRYTAAVQEFHDRLMRQATTRRDFSMLLPEQYLTAARRAPVDALASVFAATVFDPPRVDITVGQVLTAAADHQPPPPRQRLPRPPARPPGPDPVETARARAARARERREAAVTLLMGGRAEADLTEELRALPWRTAVRHVVDLLRVAADPDLPFMLHISRQVMVDPSGPVTYASPMAVYRLPDGPQDMHDHDDDSESTPADPS